MIWATVVACAQAGTPNMNGGDDDMQRFDASPRPPVDDAPIRSIDAPVSGPDASNPPPADASVGGPDASDPLFCNVDTDCVNAGECCFFIGNPPGFCVAGSDVFGVCLPSS